MGYDAAFLGEGMAVAVPQVEPPLDVDLVLLDGSPVIAYTHFSLALSRSRRLARWVAWNIDGARFEFADSITRDGVKFVEDPRLPIEVQTLDGVYAGNSLDRGHLARRSDLLWGTLAEATQANKDSFYFTNIAPQRDTFNQSRAAGIWGELEDALLESAKADRKRVNVFAGPVLAPDDLAYRGVLVPYSFWKLIVYATGGQLQAHAFVLRQNLDGLEQIALEDFVVYEVFLDDLEERTGLRFDSVLATAPAPAATDALPHAVRSKADVDW